MKDIVTFETAVRLKEAGFPQPFAKVGMFGYNDAGHLFVRTHDGSVASNRYGSVLLNGGNDNITLSNKDFKFVVFAPTATDILREMPGCILVVENLYKEMAIVGVYYEVWKTGRLLSDHAKPAEAVAEAWLKLNEKK